MYKVPLTATRTGGGGGRAGSAAARGQYNAGWSWAGRTKVFIKTQHGGCLLSL